MKRLLLLLFLISSVVLAHGTTKKVKGTIIKGTIRKSVTFVVPYYIGTIDYVKAKRGLVYYKSGKKKKLKPKDADRVELDIGDKKITLVSKVLLTLLGKKTYFIRPDVEGKITYYTLELSHGSERDINGNIVPSGSGGTFRSSPQSVSYLEKEGVGIKGYTRKNVQRFISDCTYIMDKLNGKKWWETDIELVDLLNDYNENCGK